MNREGVILVILSKRFLRSEELALGRMPKGLGRAVRTSEPALRERKRPNGCVWLASLSWLPWEE